MSENHQPASGPILSRRSLLASASAFAIVAPQAVRGSQANSRISVGLIGSGGRGSYDASIVHAAPRAAISFGSPWSATPKPVSPPSSTR